jgi:hypothetical protein
MVNMRPLNSLLSYLVNTVIHSDDLSLDFPLHQFHCDPRPMPCCDPIRSFS